MKGMILAAGFGQRLLPLTKHLPKPMLPAANMPLIDFALFRLHTLGITDAAVNLHHLPDPIKEKLAQGSRFGQRITFSEEPRILGTGGGVKQMREWVGKNDLAIVNGDTVFLSMPEQIAQIRRETDALAVLALLRTNNSGRFSPVKVDRGGLVADIRDETGAQGDFATGVFTGLSIISPELFDFMPQTDNFCMVNDVYIPLLKSGRGKIAACFVEGDFFDMGTPQDYLAGNIAILKRHLGPYSLLAEGLRNLGDNVFIGSNVHFGWGSNLRGPCIIGNDVRIEGGSQIGPFAAVGDGSIFGAWTRLVNSVALPKTFMPGGGLHINSVLYERQSMQVELESPQ